MAAVICWLGVACRAVLGLVRRTTAKTAPTQKRGVRTSERITPSRKTWSVGYISQLRQLGHPVDSIASHPAASTESPPVATADWPVIVWPAAAVRARGGRSDSYHCFHEEM